MTTIPTIEKGVPLPSRYSTLWDKMEVGDSFVVVGENERNNARTSFWNYRRKSDRFPQSVAFVSKLIGDKTYRIWLIDNSTDP